jgi:hypothetical protein
VAAAAVALARNLRARMALLSILLAGDAFVLFAFPELSAPRSVTIDRSPIAFLQRNLGLGRFFTLGPLQPSRRPTRRGERL